MYICPSCKGSGLDKDKLCPDCLGTGQVPEARRMPEGTMVFTQEGKFTVKKGELIKEEA